MSGHEDVGDVAHQRGHDDGVDWLQVDHRSGSNAAGSSATQASTSGSSTNTCRRSPAGGTVTKILPRTRNDDMSKCGSSVTPGRDSANRRALERSLTWPG